MNTIDLADLYPEDGADISTLVGAILALQRIQEFHTRFQKSASIRGQIAWELGIAIELGNIRFLRNSSYHPGALFFGDDLDAIHSRAMQQPGLLCGPRINNYLGYYFPGIQKGSNEWQTPGNLSHHLSDRDYAFRLAPAAKPGHANK